MLTPRSRALALVLAAALALAGAATPAQAEDLVSITGRVLLPAGVDLGSLPEPERPVVTYWHRDPGSNGSFMNAYLGARVHPDGTFTLASLRPDFEYQLFLNPGGAPLESGFVDAEGDPRLHHKDAAVLTAPAEVTIRAHAPRGFAGKVELPQGFDYDPGNPPRVTPAYLTFPFGPGPWFWLEKAPAPVAPDGSFETGIVHTQEEHRLALRWPDGRVVFWTSDRTVPTADESLQGVTFARGDVVFPLLSSLELERAPRVSGTVRLGKSLRVEAGRWSNPAAKESYQWLRDGQAIKSAAGRSYRLTKKDIGKRLSVQVRASAPGWTSETTTTARTPKVPKVAPKVSVKLVKKGTTAKRLVVKVRVRTSAVTARPTGTVRVTFRGKSRTKTLKAKQRGTITIKVPRSRTKGTVKVRFSPTKSTKKYVSKGSASLKVKR